MTIDLGRISLGDQIPPFNFDIYNLASPFGDELTARLDLDSIEIIPAAGGLSISGPLFDNLAAGEGEQFTITGVADELGSFKTHFIVLLSDENLPGEMTQIIELRVTYEVVVKNMSADSGL